MTFEHFYEKYYNGWMVNSIDVCLMDKKILEANNLNRANVGAFILMIAYMEYLGKFLDERGDPLEKYLERCMKYRSTESELINKSRNDVIHHFIGGKYCQIVENSSMHRIFRKDRIVLDINRFADEFKKSLFVLRLILNDNELRKRAAALIKKKTGLQIEV